MKIEFSLGMLLLLYTQWKCNFMTIVLLSRSFSYTLDVVLTLSYMISQNPATNTKNNLTNLPFYLISKSYVHVGDVDFTKNLYPRYLNRKVLGPVEWFPQLRKGVTWLIPESLLARFTVLAGSGIRLISIVSSYASRELGNRTRLQRQWILR